MKAIVLLPMFITIGTLLSFFAIALAPFPAQATISVLPSNESFEYPGGHWDNVTGDNMDWTRKTGSTGSSGTGPSSAYDGSYYYYTEASSPNYPSKTSWLVGPTFDLTNYSSATFTFYYHMYGTSMGTLKVEASTNGTTWTSLWTKTGNQGNQWSLATVDFDSYAGSSVTVRFTGTTGSSYTSDMAIDKVTMSGVEANTPASVFVQNASSYSESFESSDGTWINESDDDDFDWTRHTGSTTTTGTGPSSAYEGNYYFYTESSVEYPYKQAILRGPDFTFSSALATATLSFRYHMDGNTMGTLALEASTDAGTTWTGIWSKSGDQGDSWNLVSISLDDYLDDGVSLRLVGITATNISSDMAVDDMEISVGTVQTLAAPQVQQNYIHSTIPQTAAGTSGSLLQSVQYFDGLGRPVQTVQYEASPDQDDIITSLAYDAYGRQHRSYLPYAKTNNDGEYDSGFATVSNYTTSYGTTDDDYAFSEIVFESSPLNRTSRQCAPGHAWRSGQNREVKHGYGNNSASEVRLLTITNVESGATPGYYGAGQLYKSTTWDENQTNDTTTVSRVEEYTDKLGRVVCKKVFEQTDEHATYYVYDELGNLAYVVPPKVDLSDGVSSTELDELCFRYSYDGRNRMIEKKVPGAGVVYMVYDTRDRLVLTQDSVQRAETPTKEWTFTKYDVLNRPVMTGIYQSNSSHSSLQATVMAKTGTALYESFGTGYTDGYSNRSFPTSGVSKKLTITYYDNYAFTSLTGFGTEFDFDNANSINNGPEYATPKGLVTGGKT